MEQESIISADADDAVIYLDLELQNSLFFEDFRDSYSEMICIFPYFCPYRQFTRAGLNYTTITKKEK